MSRTIAGVKARSASSRVSSSFTHPSLRVGDGKKLIKRTERGLIRLDPLPSRGLPFVGLRFPVALPDVADDAEGHLIEVREPPSHVLTPFTSGRRHDLRSRSGRTAIDKEPPAVEHDRRHGA